MQIYPGIVEALHLPRHFLACHGQLWGEICWISARRTPPICALINLHCHGRLIGIPLQWVDFEMELHRSKCQRVHVELYPFCTEPFPTPHPYLLVGRATPMAHLDLRGLHSMHQE